MRDFAIETAKKERFLQKVYCQTSMLHQKNENHLLMTSLPQTDKRLRRLDVRVRQQQLVQTSTLHTTATSSTLPSPDISRAPNLRTLSIEQREDEEGGEEDCTRLMETICKDYPLLRVLAFAHLRIKGKLPKKVGNLIHLRYLGLCNLLISEVPSSIEKLQLLQTLALDSRLVLSLPNVLWKLRQLRRLALPCFHCFQESGNEPTYLVQGGGELLLDGLCNLQTLMNIDLDSVSLKGLSNLDRLKTLHAKCETRREALYPLLNCASLKEVWLILYGQVINEDPMILSSCEALTLLTLYGRKGSPVHLNERLCLEMLPKSLAILSLCYLQLDADPLPVLEQLPNLQKLLLRHCDGLSVIACSASGFPQLTELVFTGLSEFYSWEVEEGALPKLKKLWIADCPLKKAPDAIRSSVTVFIE